MVPLNLQRKGVREIGGFGSICYEEKWKKEDFTSSFVNNEPTSVLHMRSPSPPNSASTLSSSAAAPPELGGWEGFISASPADRNLDLWVAGNVDATASFGELLQLQNRSVFDHDPIFSSGSNNFDPVSVPAPCGFGFQEFESQDLKPQILNGNMNPSFLIPFPFTDQNPQIKRHGNIGNISNISTSVLCGGLDPKPPIPDLGHEFLLRRVQTQNLDLGSEIHPEMGLQDQNQQEQGVLDQIYRAAEQLGFGNFSHAQAILARLNHQLSAAGKPLHRAALYFKEAMQLLGAPRAPPAPIDVIFKMGAYKAFSDLSPITHFANFTSNQALLECLGGDGPCSIHIYDFDVGFGAQWASFMQELPGRNGVAGLALKITAFASPATHHPVELELMRVNLTQFAFDIGLSFELEVVNFDSLDQNSYSVPLLLPSGNEAVAVNFPTWVSSDRPSAFPGLLRLVKQLSPKIVVSLDRGCDRSDLAFPQHLCYALQSYSHLLESLDAVNATPDTVNKIERFLIQPRIESTVLGRLRSPEKMPMWKTLFASAGFSPVPFSNFTETQAECVVRRTPVRGFHVEKRGASLTLCWQGRELVSASAWRC